MMGRRLESGFMNLAPNLLWLVPIHSVASFFPVSAIVNQTVAMESPYNSAKSPRVLSSRGPVVTLSW